MKKFTPVLILVLALSASMGETVGKVDLADYYPNQAESSDFYLEGTTSSGYRAVLWFEELGLGAFRQFNSAPEDSSARCNWDFLGWLDGVLAYKVTLNECSGNVETVTAFNPPIVFMPRYWDERPWSYTSESRMLHYEDEVLVCTGTTSYTSTVKLAETGEIHFRTTQTTVWDDFGKCAGWDDTRWQENYFFGELPGGKGLTYAVGGPQGTTDDSWDIKFHKWEELPKQTVNE